MRGPGVNTHTLTQLSQLHYWTKICSDEGKEASAAPFGSCSSNCFFGLVVLPSLLEVFCGPFVWFSCWCGKSCGVVGDIPWFTWRLTTFVAGEGIGWAEVYGAWATVCSTYSSFLWRKAEQERLSKLRI